MNKIKNLFLKLGKTGSYFLKGILIGIAMIIPGVSGGTLAVILKIYDDLLEAINGLFKHFVKSIKTLLPVLLGAVVGFVLLVFPLKWGLANCPLIVVTLFVGFIIGSLPSLYKNVKGKENPISISWGILFLVFMILLCFIPSRNEKELIMNGGTFFLLILVGFIISCALVAPGISGSMLLMVMGFYETILDVISQIIKFENISQNLLILLPIFIGVIFGFFIISFIMEKLLKKFPTSTYFAILGLILGSIACIYTKTFTDYEVNLSFIQISLSVISLLAGGILSYLIGRVDLKQENEKLKEENEVENNG